MTQPEALLASMLDTYAERQSAHSRSRLTRLPMLEDDRGEARDEVVDAHVSFRLLTPPLVHADRAVLHVGVPDHEDIRDLLGLGAPDARAQLPAGAVDQLGPEALGLHPVDQARAVRVVTVAHRQDGDLHR